MPKSKHQKQTRVDVVDQQGTQGVISGASEHVDGPPGPPGFFSQPRSMVESRLAIGETVGLTVPTLQSARSVADALLESKSLRASPLLGSGGASSGSSEWPLRNLVSEMRSRLEASSECLDSLASITLPLAQDHGNDVPLEQLPASAPLGRLSSESKGESDIGEAGVFSSDGSPESRCRFMELSTMSLGAGGPIHEAPRIANELLQKTITELDKSRNLNKDIKEAVLVGLHGLYEMVLRLTDSRCRHIAEKERVRATAHKQQALLQKLHASKLEAINTYVQTNLEDLRRTGYKTYKETEAMHLMVIELQGKMMEVPTQSVAVAVGPTEVDKLADEVRALREECRRLKPLVVPPPEGHIESISGAPTDSFMEKVEMPRFNLGDGMINYQEPVAGFRRGRGFVSYAAAAGASYPLIIESRNPNHSGDQIISTIKSGVDVVNMGVGISGMRKCKNSRVAITLESERERTVMEDAIKGLGDDFTVTQPQMREPQLRLIGVISEMSDVKVEEALIRQNPSMLLGLLHDDLKVKVVRRVKGRNNGLSNIIIQVSPKVWGCLRDRRVRLGYQMITAVDQSPILQCYKCLGFSHRAADCRVIVPKCGYCALSHDTRECSNKNHPPNCTNCQVKGSQNCDHPAYSSDCPEWRRWDRLARAAVRYC